jgi:hypothetical protein
MKEGLKGPDKQQEEPESKIVKYLREHGFPKLREIDLEVLAAEHTTDENATKVSEEAKDADVFAMEHHGWDKKLKTHFQNVADDKEAASRDVFPAGDDEGINFWYGLSKRFQGTGKRIALPEPRKDLNSSQKIQDLVHLWLGFLPFIVKEKFPTREEARNVLKFAIEQGAKANKLRESYIARYFAHELQRVLKNDPRFTNAETISVKMFMGSAHTSLIPTLRKVHPGTERKYLDGSKMHTYDSEALRRMMFGLPIEDRLLDDALVENILTYLGIRPGSDFPQNEGGKALMMRSLIPELSEEERESLYKAAMRDRKEGQNFFDSMISRKDMNIPQDWERFFRRTPNQES